MLSEEETWTGDKNARTRLGQIRLAIHYRTAAMFGKGYCQDMPVTDLLTVRQTNFVIRILPKRSWPTVESEIVDSLIMSFR